LTRAGDSIEGDPGIDLVEEVVRGSRLGTLTRDAKAQVAVLGPQGTPANGESPGVIDSALGPQALGRAG